MAASQRWSGAAARELESLLGRDLALKAVDRLIVIPGANASAAGTLAAARAKLLVSTSDE